MGGHGVAETFFATNESLIGEAAEDSREPFMVGQAKDGGGGKERAEVKTAKGHRLKVGPDDGTIDEGTVENFFQRRDY